MNGKETGIASVSSFGAGGDYLISGDSLAGQISSELGTEMIELDLGLAGCAAGAVILPGEGESRRPLREAAELLEVVGEASSKRLLTGTLQVDDVLADSLAKASDADSGRRARVWGSAA